MADANAARSDLPRHADLTGHDGVPPGASWGLFGVDDEVGTLNLIGTQQVLDAAGLVRTGQVFPLDWSIDLPDPPILGRGASQHSVIAHDNGTNDDWIDGFYPQRSSQWDALAHVRHPRFGYYNGTPAGQVPTGGGTRLGIHNFARRGIVGRFVLADIAAHRLASGDPLDPACSLAVLPDELDAVLEDSGVRLGTGDILLLRFGWTRWYEQQDETTRRRLGNGEVFSSPGLARSEAVAAWLWDHRVAAVAADVPALEVMPFDLSHEDGFLHFRLIPLLGMAIGEMFDLERLAAECRNNRTYEGLFVSAPLHKVGGIGSPANSVAIM